MTTERLIEILRDIQARAGKPVPVEILGGQLYERDIRTALDESGRQVLAAVLTLAREEGA